MWALIMMACVRTCVPQYVQLFDSYESCKVHVVEAPWYDYQKTYCIPIVKIKKM